MTRITNADQVLLLLQDQIRRLAKTNDSARRDATGRSGTPEPMARVRALAARDGLSDDDLKRALVRGLLVQQLGEAIGNDPAFEAVAGDVLRIMRATPEGRDLLDRALAQLSSGHPI